MARFHFLSSFLWIFTAVLPSLHGENLVFNGSFELGTDGFAQKRLLRPDTNPQLIYSPLESVSLNPFSGKKALQIRNSGAEMLKIIGKEFPVKKGHVYTFRGAIRSSAPNTRLTVKTFSENSWEAQSLRINADTEWKEFSYEFTPFNSDPHHLVIEYSDKNNIPAGTLWIDRLEITESGKNGKNGLQLAIRAPEAIIETGTDVAIELAAINDSETVVSEKFELICTEDYDGTVLFRKKFNLALKPGEVSTTNFRFPATHNGGYTATVKGTVPLRFQQADFIVCSKIPRRITDLSKDYVFGINWGLRKFWEPGTQQKGYLVYNAPFAKDIEMLADIGCRVLRDHDAGYDAASWALLEPEEGKFDTQFLRRDIEVLKKYSIQLFINLGRFNFFVPHNWQGVFWPLWLKDRCRIIQEKAPTAFGSRKTWFPPEEHWRRYVAKVIETAGTNVEYYELFNEANMGCRAKDYVRYSKIAAEEIRRLNPKAKTVGICITSDGDSVKGPPFVRECVKLGILDFCDIASFHPYSSRELNSTYPADRYIADFRKDLGKPIPVWNTELYYLFDSATFGMSQAHGKPHQLAARFLVDLGEGCQQSTAIHADVLWKQPLLPSMNHHGYAKTHLAPHANMAAAAALVRFFEGAIPAGKRKLDAGTIFYLYRKNGEYIGAMWNYRHRDGVIARYPKTWKLYDLYGNPVRTNGSVQVTDRPFYVTNITFSEAADEQLSRLLSDRWDFPVKASAYANVLPGQVILTLTGLSSRKNVLGLSLANTKKLVSVAVPPHGSANAVLECRKEAEALALTLHHNGKTKELQLPSHKRILIKPGTAQKTSGRSFSVATRADIANNTLELELCLPETFFAPDAENSNPEHRDFIELLLDTDPITVPPIAPERYNARCARIRFWSKNRVFPEVQVLAALSGIRITESSVIRDSAACTVRLKAVLPPWTRKNGFIGFDWRIRHVSNQGTEDLYLSGDQENGFRRINYLLLPISENAKQNGQ